MSGRFRIDASFTPRTKAAKGRQTEVLLNKHKTLSVQKPIIQDKIKDTETDSSMFGTARELSMKEADMAFENSPIQDFKQNGAPQNYRGPVRFISDVSDSMSGLSS